VMPCSFVIITNASEVYVLLQYCHVLGGMRDENIGF
jgi:hypothetical protein